MEDLIKVFLSIEVKIEWGIPQVIHCTFKQYIDFHSSYSVIWMVEAYATVLPRWEAGDFHLLLWPEHNDFLSFKALNFYGDVVL